MTRSPQETPPPEVVAWLRVAGMADEDMAAWWLEPTPALADTSPADEWRAGNRAAVEQLIEGSPTY